MQHQNFIEKLNERVSFEMIFVEGGSFMMGGQDDETRDNEKPLYEVTLPGYYIGKFLLICCCHPGGVESSNGR